MVPSSTLTLLGVAAAFGLFGPIIIAFWWVKTKKEKISTVIIGAGIWFFFAIILEGIPKSLLFNPETPIGKTINGNVVLFTLIGALLAGVFEETGRFIAFKTILKNRINKETSISYGIGHGGMEVMYILVFSAIQSIVFASMINDGTFQTMLDEVASGGVDISSMEAVKQQILSITALQVVMMIVERVFALLLHVGLSIMVFFGARDNKIKLFILAILAHALFDVPAALYQFGTLNLYVVEGILAVFSVVFFIIVRKKFYLTDGEAV